MFKKIWGNNTFDTTILKSYSSNSPWKGDAVLFYIENGLGRLKRVYGEAKDGTMKSFVLLNDIPLIKWHSQDSYNCPTCEKLISAGYGLDKVDKETMDFIRSYSNRSYETIQASIDQVEPILKLLKSGYYALADIELYLVDGSGRFFWNITNTPKYNKASCDIGYKFKWTGGHPQYLLATQPPNRYNQKTVEFYREQLRKGEQLRGLAYHLDGFLCLLLDGHHKAVAAALEGQEFRCLTILPTIALIHEGKKLGSKVWIGGAQLDIADFPEKLNRAAYKNFGEKRLEMLQAEKFMSMEEEAWDRYEWPQELLEIGNKYPDVLGVVCVELAGELSDERIDRLLKGKDVDATDELDIVLRALIALKDERATKVAIDIARSEAWKELWAMVFTFLYSMPGNDVEDFFLEFLINDEKLRPNLTEIANDYFRMRGN